MNFNSLTGAFFDFSESNMSFLDISLNIESDSPGFRNNFDSSWQIPQIQTAISVDNGLTNESKFWQNSFILENQTRKCECSNTKYEQPRLSRVTFEIVKIIIYIFSDEHLLNIPMNVSQYALIYDVSNRGDLNYYDDNRLIRTPSENNLSFLDVSQCLNGSTICCSSNSNSFLEDQSPSEGDIYLKIIFQ